MSSHRPTGRYRKIAEITTKVVEAGAPMRIRASKEAARPISRRQLFGANLAGRAGYYALTEGFAAQTSPRPAQLATAEYRANRLCNIPRWYGIYIDRLLETFVRRCDQWIAIAAAFNAQSLREPKKVWWWGNSRTSHSTDLRNDSQCSRTESCVRAVPLR